MVAVGSVMVFLVAYNLVAAEEKVCSDLNYKGMLQSSPGKSCDDIYQNNKATRGESGLYWISTTETKQVYCDMELECGGHKGGWMRIADLNTSRGDACPTGWTKITTPGGINACMQPSHSSGCYSTKFSVNSAKYQKICGRVKGYQKGTTGAFITKGTINGNYVDGVSITIGSPRKHVWTYAAGASDNYNYPGHNCPCAATPGQMPPKFVKEHYYCESGNTGTDSSAVFYTSDALWDGNGCHHSSNYCCAEPGLPWFSRVFPSSEQEDVEVRICSDEHYNNEATLVEVVQLFVQ